MSSQHGLEDEDEDSPPGYLHVFILSVRHALLVVASYAIRWQYAMPTNTASSLRLLPPLALLPLARPWVRTH